MNNARAVVAAVLLAAGVGSGLFGGSREEKTAAGETVTRAAPGPFGKYTPGVTVTAAKNLGGAAPRFPDGDSIDDNVWTRYFEEILGITVKYAWTSGEQQYAQKVNVSITSHNIPDIMIVNSTQLKMMYENDQLRDMTDILEEYLAPFTREVLYQDNGDAITSATFDGRIMAIPLTGFGLGNAQVLWVRADWLDRLGLAVPATMDEFMAVAGAFANRDPDGNNKNDTFGLGVYKDLFDGGFACLEGLFNGYGAYPRVWVPGSGGLVYGSVMPQAKTALGALQDMYRRGLLDPEFGIKDGPQVAADVTAGRVGMFFGQFWDTAWINQGKVADPAFEFVPAPIPAGAGAPAKVQLPFGTTSYAVVSARARYPEAAVKLLNLDLEKKYGATSESTRFNITPDGYGPYAYTPLAIEPGMKNFDAAAAVSDAITRRDPSRLNEEQRNYYDMSMKSLAGDHGNNNWHQLKMFGPGGSLSVIRGYWDAGGWRADQFFGPPTRTMTEKLSTLDKLALTAYTDIILGAPLDAGWDQFTRRFDLLGGAQMTREVNGW